MHALVNNAAISPKANGGKRLDAIDTAREVWGHVFQVNFFAPIMLARGLIEELGKAKSYLKGAYALNFDSSSKIAGQLVQLQLDDLGIDYVERRKGLIDAVTLADAKRVAKRVLAGPLLFAIVGRPAEAIAGDPGAAGAVKVPGALMPAAGVDAAGRRGPVSLH